MDLESRMRAATTELRRDLDRIEIPSFERRRRRTPAVAAALLLLLVGAGALLYVGSSDQTDPGAVTVATRPDATETADVASTGSPATGVLTTAEAGEFLVPIPMSPAWSPDETMLLVYRTGAAEPGHLVLDTTTGTVIAELPFDAADIEQVYWSPLVEGRLLYTAGAELRAYDLGSNSTRLLVEVEECSALSSGRAPAAPAADDTLSLYCPQADGAEQIVVDLASLDIRRSPTPSDSSARPSPSGDVLVRTDPDGTAAVLDRSLRDTGVRLALGGNDFGFVTDADGREWVATALYDEPTIGSLVLLDPSGQRGPMTIIGGETGATYPPSGIQLATAGSRVAIAAPGTDDGSLAGRVVVVDIDDAFGVVPLVSVPHDSAGLHGFWSSPFVSLSPSGRYVAVASDGGADRIDTRVLPIPD